MKRVLLWIVALVIAAAPVAGDLCRLDCERERPPECPLHQQAPHPCTHDHTIGAATPAPAGVDAPRPAAAAVAVVYARCRADISPADAGRVRIDRQHAPPIRSPRPDVLPHLITALD